MKKQQKNKATPATSQHQQADPAAKRETRESSPEDELAGGAAKGALAGGLLGGAGGAAVGGAAGLIGGVLGEDEKSGW
ncbi:hypothetical protein WME97_45885 [Sorangium sp. So ce367]|uniref:hypothetical protein n=1 Tax=Sorangium sp. So ce367 TaxID=3133305 RepID=UPI003F61C6D8